MAIMRPERIEDLGERNNADREHDVYAWLRDGLPDASMVLHEPVVFNQRRQQRRPDFLVFWERTDCLVLEVKNWRLEHIVAGDGLKVQVKRQDNRIDTLTHPMQHARKSAYAVMQHFERDYRDDPRFIEQTGEHSGKLTFCVTPVVVLLGADEADRERICKLIGGMNPESVITEEALRHPDTLRARLTAMPFPRPLLGERAILQAAADVLFPKLKTASEIEEAANRKAVDLVPEVTHVVQPSPEKPESETDRYKRLRRELSTVSGEAAELIGADLGQDDALVLQLRRLIDDLAQDHFQVGVFGVTAAGKSTFINALLGERLMRAGLGETSKTITVLRATDADHPHGASVITFKTLEEINRELLGYLYETNYLLDGLEKAPAEAGPDAETLDVSEAIVRQRLTAWTENVAPNARDRDRAAATFIRALLEGWPEMADQLGQSMTGGFDEHNDLVHTENKAVFVRERTVYHDNDFLNEGFVFVDSPGVGSSLNRHTDLAVECAKRVDAALMLTKTDYQFMPPERDFIRDALDVRRHEQHKNLFFVLNQISRINPLEQQRPPEAFDECVAEQCDRLRERLAGEGISGFEIYPVDAQCALYAQRATRGLLSEDERDAYDNAAMTDRKAETPDPERNLKASRFPDMLADLRSKLSRIKYHGFLGMKLDGLHTAVGVFQGRIQKDVEAMGRDIKALEDDLENHARNQKTVEEKLKYFLAGFKKRVQDIYEDLSDEKDDDDQYVREGKMTALINWCSERAAEIYRAHRADFYLSRERFIEKVRQDLQEELIAKIKDHRDGYEQIYRKMRQDVLDIHLKEQVGTYADERSWQFALARVDRDYAKSKSIRGIECLDVSRFRKFWSFVTHPIDKDKRHDKRSAFFGREFVDQLDKCLRTDIVSWIKLDSERVRHSILQIFEDVSAEITARIEDQIEQRQAKSKERAARERQLCRYQKQVDKLLEQLHELDDQVRLARPVNP